MTDKLIIVNDCCICFDEKVVKYDFILECRKCDAFMCQECFSNYLNVLPLSNETDEYTCCVDVPCPLCRTIYHFSY